MEWIRRRPRLATAAGILAVVVVLGIVVLMSRQQQQPVQDPTPITLPTQTPTRTPLKELPTATASTAPTTAAQVQAQAQKAFNQFGQGLSTHGGSSTISMPGLQGGSAYSFLPQHRLRMSVSSAEAISYVGWVAPTAYPKTSAIVKNIGRSWSITLTVYGDPDYGQIYVQANPSGAPIRCLISVDGRVTKDESTKGPYGRLYPCQG